jgi:hypothetical protein
MKARFLFALLAWLLVACVPPAPPAPVPPDADDGGCTAAAEQAAKCPPCVCADAASPAVDAAMPSTPCGNACTVFAEHSCEEASPLSLCLSECDKTVAAALVPWSPSCIASAKTLAALRKCPRVVCAKGK